jgi:hypothetical protein
LQGALGWVTITHPHHPLCGQRVEVVFVRRGADPDLIVRVPGGQHAAIRQSWTGDEAAPVAPVAGPVRLLDVAGLRKAAHLVAQLRQRPGAGAGGGGEVRE